MLSSALLPTSVKFTLKQSLTVFLQAMFPTLRQPASLGLSTTQERQSSLQNNILAVQKLVPAEHS